MPELYIYAELLLHIRQLTLYASLSEAKDKGTQILLSSDKKVITATYADERASIYLPTQIKGTANVTFPLGRRTEFSTKLQIDDQVELQQAIDASPDTQVPWTATSLDRGIEIQCKACSAAVIQNGVILEWKDLPSENWADLMDLWFCHKPHEHDHDDDEQTKAAESRGFSAQSSIAIESKIGLVDTITFLIHPDDSQAIQKNEEKSEASTHLLCPSCSAFVGTFNSSNNSSSGPQAHRLYKSRLQIYTQSFNPGIFLAAQLLHLIENNISRRVIVHPIPAPSESSASPAADTVADTTSDAATDVATDATPDTTAYNTVDIPSDATPDTTADNTVDIPTETPTDAPTDAPTNTTPTTPTLPPPGLLIWLFNPDIYYSSSRRCTPHPSVHRACKAFHQSIPDPLSLLENHTTTLEELALPYPEYESLIETLRESQSYMPVSARTFQDWEVGLLDRWEESGKETGEGAMQGNALNHGLDGEMEMEAWKGPKLPGGWENLYS